MFLSRFVNRKSYSTLSEEDAKERVSNAVAAMEKEKQEKDAQAQVDADTVTDDSGELEEKNTSFWEKISKLPEALFRKVLRDVLIAFAVIIVGVATAISFHEPAFCIIMIVSAYLFYTAGACIKDFCDGEIKELVLVCTAVSKGLSRVTITMMDTSSDPPKSYEFFYPYSNECPFHVDCVYTIYTSEIEAKGNIIAWKAM